MHRVTKFVEVSTGRIGYAMTEAAQSEVSNGVVWIRTLVCTENLSSGVVVVKSAKDGA